MLDQFHATLPKLAIAPGTYKSGTNPTSIVIDRQGFHSLLLALLIGAVTDDQTLDVQHSDTSGSGYASVTASDVIGDLTAFKAIAGADANNVKSLAYIGTKRYVKLTSTAAGATGAAWGAFANLLDARKGPAQ